MMMHHGTVTKEEISHCFADHFFIPKTKAQEIVEILVDQITEFIAQNKKIKISGFGTFNVHHKKERLGRNPKTGKPAVICERHSLSFRPSPILKSKIQHAS